MCGQGIEKLLEAVKNGDVSIADAMQKIKGEPFEELGFAKIDHHRGVRLGYPEVIYGESKTPDQIAQITQRLLAKENNILLRVPMIRRMKLF